MGSFSFYKECLSELQHFCLFFTLQNAARIVRALFEIALRKRWPAMTYRLLNLSKVIDKRLWGWVSPLRQFSVLPPSVLSKLEEKNLTVDKMKDMRKDEIGENSAMLICLNYQKLIGKLELSLRRSLRNQTHSGLETMKHINMVFWSVQYRSLIQSPQLVFVIWMRLAYVLPIPAHTQNGHGY